MAELADILTNPFHDDDSKPVKRLLRYIYDIVSEKLKPHQIR
jgi:hypothetical protein